LPEGVDFINTVLKKEKGTILVHCMAGQSRSASMIIAYLVQKKKMALSDAIAMVRKVRPSIMPNPGFMMQLQEFENAQLIKNKLKNDVHSSEAEKNFMNLFM